MILEKLQKCLDKDGFVKRDVIETLTNNERKALVQELSKYSTVLEGYGVIVQYEKTEITLVFRERVVDLANAMKDLLSVKFNYKDRLFRAFYLFKRFESTLNVDGNVYTGNIFKKMKTKNRVDLFHTLLNDCTACGVAIEDGLYGVVFSYPGAVLKIYSASSTIFSNEKAFVDDIVKTVFENF